MSSIIAAKLAERTGAFDLSFVFFRSPFFRGEDSISQEAKRLGFSLRCITLKRAFLRLPQEDGMLFPCRACRRILLARAARLFRRRRFDLLITGEIVGKGGLGQAELLALDQELGLNGWVLRPLSAKLLPPTQAEQEGVVAREQFLDLTISDAEVRLRQLALSLGLSPQADGRYCLLRDPVFARRCQAFARDGTLTANFVRLLEFPHLFRLGPGKLLVIASTPAEQVRLQELFLPEDVRLYIPLPGSPLGLLRAPWTKIRPEERAELIRQAAAHLLALAGFPQDRPWTVCFRAEEAEETARLQVWPELLQLREALVK
ncbi:MAG: hypothetical protein NZ651_00575 [Candidatus Bipolaricaulota bacterium]|nr:hypothetical protein [Candidatus Bipolaricaulota bacterium]MDW8126267.1 hypothetical protein [Candidatus Bipolaricaulota bacterium]